jgi:subtilisin family serine protease
MRPLLALILFLAASLPALSQGYAISAGTCLRPGGSFAVSGSFPNRVGDILLVDGTEATALTVRGWSSARVRLVLPRDAGAGSFGVVWRQTAGAEPGTRGWVPLGRVQVCPAGDRPERVPQDVVRAPGGGPEYLVSVAPGDADAAARVLADGGAEIIRTTPLSRLDRVLLVVALPRGLTVDEARALLQPAAPSARIDLHHIYGFADGPRLYAAALVGDDPARPCGLRSPVAVGMIDGPVNPGHPALSEVETITTSVLETGERPVSRDHGTAIAALIAGRAAPFPGLAPGARIYAVTAFSAADGGSGRLEAIALGLDWLAGQGVRIVNLSMEGSPNAAFEDVLSQSRAAGMVMIAAMGNEGTDAPRYPAASASTIAVTAVDAAGRGYDRANRGAHVEFAAPGVDLYVAQGAGGGYRSGTSYAAPIVTALVARLSASGALSLDAARTRLARGARDLGAPGRDSRFGFGLVQTGGC